jgi:5S rRNA maturation endonuclease (ribonuclease M5)
MLGESEIEEFWKEIENITNSTVIVEGKNDKKPLLKLGIKNVLDISGKPFNEILEKTNGSAVILTDFDNEGRKKASILTKLFQSNGTRVNSLVRRKIKSIFKIQKIEELNSFTKLLEDDLHGKIGSIDNKIFNRGKILNRWNSRKARHNRSNLRTN